MRDKKRKILCALESRRVLCSVSRGDFVVQLSRRYRQLGPTMYIRFVTKLSTDRATATLQQLNSAATKSCAISIMSVLVELVPTFSFAMCFMRARILATPTLCNFARNFAAAVSDTQYCLHAAAA